MNNIENKHNPLKFPEAATASAAVDPLDMPAGGIEEPKYPLLPEKIYRMVISKAEKTQSKEPNEKTGQHSNMWALTLRTTKNELDTEGKTVYEGFSFTVRTMLDVNESRSGNQIASECAMPIKAVLGANTKVTPKQAIDNPSLITDKPVDVKVTISKGKGGFPDSNTVKPTNWIVPSA